MMKRFLVFMIILFNAAIVNAQTDTTSPVLTLTPDDQTATLDGTTWTVVFNITSSEPVATLNDPASYALSFVAANADFNNPIERITTPSIVMLNDTSVRITFVRDLAHIPELQRRVYEFRLERRGTSLVDASGNPPISSFDPNTIIPAQDEETYGEIYRLVREFNGPQITVSVVDLVDQSGPPNTEAALPNSSSPNDYLVRFFVTNTDHSSQPIPNLGLNPFYRIFRQRKDGTFTETGVAQATDADNSSFISNASTATLSYTVTLTSLAIAQDTVGFTLARTPGTLLSNQDNPPRVNGATIGNLAVFDPNAISRKDSTPPQFTVTGAAAPVSEGSNDYNISFTVALTPSDVEGTGTDPKITGFGQTTAYKIFRIQNEGDDTSNVSSFPTRVLVNNITNVATIEYAETIDSSDPPFGFQLRRGPSPSLSDLAGNEPVDPANSTRTVAVDEPLDSRIAAMALTETVPPQITGVSPVSIDPIADTQDEYDITLDIRANKPIRSPSSGIFPMVVNSANVATRLDERGFSLISSTNRDNDNSVRYVFRITVSLPSAARRAIKGYTLGTVQSTSTRITDLAGNVALRNDGSALYTDDTAGSANNLVTFYQTNAQGAQVSGGNPIDSQIQLRPTVTDISVTTLFLTENSNLEYSGAFRVQSVIPDLFITNIGRREAYQLLRIPLVNGSPGTPVPVAGTIISPGVPPNSSNPIDYIFPRVNLSIEEARQTFAFTMGINPRFFRLLDPYGNENQNLVRITPDGTEINKTSPRISIAASDSSADVENGVIAIEFTTTADQEMPTLNSTASYQVALVNDNGSGPDTILLVVPPDDVTSGSASGNGRQATIAYNVNISNLPLAQLGAVEGLTLVRAADNALIDWSANPPAKSQSGDAIGVGMNGLISEVTDGEIDTLVTINRTPTTMTVIAVSAQADGGGQNDANFLNEYTILFDVESASDLIDIGDPSSYVVMRQPISTSILQTISRRDRVVGELVSGSVRGSQAELRFTVQLPLDVARDTAGFTLGRAGPDEDCNLCNILGNPTLRAGDTHGTGVIEINERIDNDPRAFVTRDTQPPILMVSLDEQNSRIRSDGNGWDIGFDVTGADVADIPRIESRVLPLTNNDESQFRLLGRYNDNRFRVLPTTLTPVYPEVSACEPADRECRSVQASFDLPPSEARQIHSFVLGRAPEGLWDSSANAPIVANTATEVVVRTDPNDSLPLDWTGTGWVLNRVPPRINVENLPNSTVRIGNRVMGRFELRADGAPPGQNEIINGINDPDSYILLAISTGSTLTRPLRDATIDVEDSPNNFRTVVRFDVTDPEISGSGHSQWMYTLGRRANLTDKAGNQPVDAGTTVSDVVLDIDDRLDSRDAALFTIPDRDTPQLTITATSAIGSVNNPLLFTGSFRFTSDEDLVNITKPSSYEIVRIKNDTSEDREMTSQTITVTGSAPQGPITIEFEVTLADIAEVRDTSGFRLKTTIANADGLPATPTDDSAPDSRRDNVPPSITVVAQGIDGEEAQPDENNPLVFTGSFNVSAEGDEVIRNIDNPSAYKLLRVDDDGSVEDIASRLTVSGLVGSATSGYTLATVSFTTTLTAGEIFTDTKGFTLGNDDSQNVGLQDISGNLAMMLEAQSDLLDGGDDAIAERDRPLPVIMVLADGMAKPSDDDPNQYTGSFTVTAENVSVPTIDDDSSYKLLRIIRNNDGTVNPDPVNQTALITVVSQSSTQVTVDFGVSLIDIDITRATHGFTLGVGNDDALRSDQGYAPERGTNGRIDRRDAAVAERDSGRPQLTVVAKNHMATKKDSEEGANIISYSMRFDVTASEPVKDIGSTTSYSLLVLPAEIQTTGTTMITVTTGANVTTATVDVTVSISASDEEATNGFTLGYNITSATLLNLNLNDQSGNLPMFGERGRLDRRLMAVASTKPVIMECAAFYPNIGQRQLFFRVLSQLRINEAGLTLRSGTSPQGLLVNVEQIGDTTDDGISILRATLDSEITDSVLSVSYQPEDLEVPGVMIACIADDITDFKDEDGDNLIDIVDSNPFDPNVATPNADTFASEQRVDAPSLSDNYYNRTKIIRSLLAGAAFEPFTYVVGDEGTSMRPTISEFSDGMSIAEYLGTSTNTKFFKVSEDSDCELVLNAAYANQLGNVKLDEFCGREIDFTTAEVGSARYAEVNIGDNGQLQLSITNAPTIHTLEVLPEINFSGQSSYLFASQTAKSVRVSAYIGENGGSADLRVRAYSYNEDGGYLDRSDNDIELRSQSANGSEVISASYDIARNGSPGLGETILYWLEGDRSVWSPDNAPLSAQRGGHNLSAEAYAIGRNNNIAVRVADADNPAEQITRIHQILLYEHSGSTLTKVSSMVVDRTYVVVADIDTNITTLNAVVATQLMDKYTIDRITNEEQSAAHVTLRDMLSRENELENSENFEFIQLTVDRDLGERDGGMIARDVVTVGWDEIGNAEGITVDYLVFLMQPPAYAEVDSDGDNVPDMIASNTIDSYPTSSTRLQVTIAGNSGNFHYVLARDGSGGQLPMFLTHAGLAIAADSVADAPENNRTPGASDYSAANIKYDGINRGTTDLLGITTDTAIYSIATFGVSDVEYSFEHNDAGMLTEILGGTVYVTFPIDNVDSGNGETLYIGKYDSDNGRWERFDTMGTDTWYAIERRGPPFEPCPQDIETYRNGHMGTADGGFTGSMDNCIMLVITDGHPLHDESSRDGRVIDPISVGPVQFSEATGTREDGGGRRGGRNGPFGIGATGSGDVLFLLTALALLLVASIVRRRQPTTNSPPLEGG